MAGVVTDGTWTAGVLTSGVWTEGTSIGGVLIEGTVTDGTVIGPRCTDGVPAGRSAAAAVAGTSAPADRSATETVRNVRAARGGRPAGAAAIAVVFRSAPRTDTIRSGSTHRRASALRWLSHSSARRAGLLSVALAAGRMSDTPPRAGGSVHGARGTARSRTGLPGR